MFRITSRTRRIRKTLVRQQDQSDCGVACLATVIRFHGGEITLERLREMSGTDQQGTTLLGLYQAARQTGFNAKAYRADLQTLQQQAAPVILHVLKAERLQHYLVCYGFDQGRFLIGDPGGGLSRCSPDELARMWESRSLLTLEPGPGFKHKRAVRQDQWQWITGFAREDLNILGLALVLGLVISVLSLSTAIFSQKLIDEILPNQDRDKLFLGLALLGILLLAKNGFAAIRQRFLIDQRRDFNTRVIHQFFHSLVRLPQPFFFSRRTGDLIARMNDTHRLQSAVAYVIGDVMIDVLLFLIAAFFILMISVSLGLLALGSLPLYLLLAFAFHQPIVRGQRQVMAAHSANESNYVDVIRGLATIKTQNKEGHFAGLTGSIYRFFQEKIHHLGQIGVGFNLWAETIGTVMLLAVLSWSAALVLDGLIRVGEMVAVLQMANLLIPGAMNISLTNLRLQEARVAFERMYEFASLNPEYVPDRRHEAGPFPLQSLEVQDLAFRFPGRPPLLQNLGFRVTRGEIIALLGESGCGKTTTLQILQRFYQPEKGRVCLNGHHPWDQISTPAWRSMIGVVPQQITLFHGTLLDNICLGDTRQELESVIRFCRTYGFEKYFARFPQGYATRLGEEGMNISGGQRQLVAFARALYRQPQLLLVDEATAEMDRDTEARILDLLTRLKRDMGIILVTHQVRCTKYADRIYILENGTVSSAGAPGELSQGDNLFARSLEDTSLQDLTMKVEV